MKRFRLSFLGPRVNNNRFVWFSVYTLTGYVARKQCLHMYVTPCVLFDQSDTMKEAEVAAYFKKFDQAERKYIDMDRR